MSKFSIQTPKRRLNGLAIILILLGIAALVSASVQLVVSLNTPTVYNAQAARGEPPAVDVPPVVDDGGAGKGEEDCTRRGAECEPAPEPEPAVTAEPTEDPGGRATPEPVVDPTTEPVVEPTKEPVVEPTAEPTKEPVVEPT
ncbi:MAG TPA: hypothetical protein VFG99_09260, partial [Chloroflexia bacterium]|nr:hypothetical protein [Chloroflexia bacterium]